MRTFDFNPNTGSRRSAEYALRTKGPVQYCIDIVALKGSAGLDALIMHGIEHLAVEAHVLRNPALFAEHPKTLAQARLNLEAQGIDVDAMLRAFLSAASSA